MTVANLEDELAEAAHGPVVTRVQVVGLFGKYNYTIDVPTDINGEPTRLLLLYGDNGSGKTTILRLLFHVLSPAEERGHRTEVAGVPFRSIDVAFSDGSSIFVEKTNGLLGTHQLRLRRPRMKEVVVLFEADENGVVRRSMSGAVLERYLSEPSQKFLPDRISKAMANEKAEDEYLRFLRSAALQPILLADDRSIYSDHEGYERARERAFSVGSDPYSAVGAREGEPPGVARDLTLTLSRLNEQLRRLAIRGQSVGSAEANTIYGNVLRQLAMLSPRDDATGSPESAHSRSAFELLSRLASLSPRFEEFELVPHFAAEEFRDLLDRVPIERKTIAHEILIPYLNSLTARIESLATTESTLRALLSTLNGFLVDKRFVFSPRHGLRIVTDDGDVLPATSLSSGERQLTMLLCTTLLARGESRLFIIDEPELSLGIPWQRQILEAMLTLTRGTTLQFIVATHSVEMVTSNRESFVRLERDSRAVAR